MSPEGKKDQSHEHLKLWSILVMEDVPEMNEMIRGMLDPVARRVHSAANRPDMMFELLKRRPDLVLLDEIIPGESLESLLGEIRTAGCKVILMTSLAGRESNPLPAGVLARIQKPEWKARGRFISDVAQLVAPFNPGS